MPVSLAALSLAFWKRSLWFGIAVLAFIAVAKILWSAAFGGASGRAILAPAIIGLVLCIALVYIGFIRLEKKNGADGIPLKPPGRTRKFRRIAPRRRGQKGNP